MNKNSPAASDVLSPLRSEIDKIDSDLIKLIQKRAKAAIELGKLKKKHSLPIMDLAREKQVIGQLTEAVKPGDGLTLDAMSALFTEIIKACRAAQAPTKVAFLGPAGTFSHAAALEQFGKLALFIPCDDLPHVFEAAGKGEADFAVVPFENTTEGIVGQTLDLMTNTDLRVQVMMNLKVNLSLMSRHGDLSRIKTISSHPQALAQCRGWLALNLPGVELLPTVSSAVGANLAVNDDAVAVIGHPQLATVYNLLVMSDDLQDLQHNQTCFFIMSRDDSPPTGKDRTLAWFAAPHNSGSLYKCLQPLASSGVNLTRLHSRPNSESPWEYLFFLELEGHFTEEKVIAALKALGEQTDRLRVLGSYEAPAGERDLKAPIAPASLSPNL
ncbi:MAG: prephenate dehydratase [Deltaproteobacteria bacterium]|jgi:chorismate mutase/prephenate dehydratase|nr:prephenate dehydratase [Deltaproteobacteria bacterium]